MRIFDLHNDFLTENYFDYKNYINNKIIVNSAVYKGNLTFNDAYNLVKNFKNLNLKNFEISFEDISYPDLDLDLLFSLNPLCISLTYNEENEYGFGVNENKGLKNKGIEMIKILNENEVVVDTSHLSRKGILDVCENAKRVINTHSCFDFLYKHKRNLTSLEIKKIVERRGIIGLTFVGYFLSKKQATINDLVKSVCYFCDNFGIDNLCIGSDFNGTDNLVKNLKSYSDLIFFKEELLKAGFSNVEIDKIFYKNAYDFFKR